MYVNQLSKEIQELLIARLEELNFTPEDIQTALDSKVSDVTEAALIDANLLEESVATVETDATNIIVSVRYGHKDADALVNTLKELGYRFVKSQHTFKKANNRKQRGLLREASEGFKLTYVYKAVK